MTKHIDSIFEEMKISKNHGGYFYLHTAVQMALKDPAVLRRITQTLYPSIAKQFGNTPSGIERAMSHAIKAAWLSETPTKLSMLNHKPTNRVFIGYVADLVSIEKKSELLKKKKEEQEKNRLIQSPELPFLK